MWPPGPERWTSTLSQAAVIDPARSPTCPVVSRGSQWRAKMRSTSLRAPPSMASSAPPGTVSSAGWNTMRTRPGRAGAEASASAAPSRIVAWASWPHAWQAPSIVER